MPNGEQRIWRSLTRMKVQLTRDRVRLQNQMECLLEEMRIKLSIVVSNLLGARGYKRDSGLSLQTASQLSKPGDIAACAFPSPKSGMMSEIAL